MRVGSGDFTYDYVDGWLKLPPDWSLGWIGSIATDRLGRVFCFNRGTRPMTVLGREGEVIGHWGDAEICYAHGVFMDRHERLWLTDQLAHVVWIYGTDGTLHGRLGYPYVTSASAGLFNQPTNTFVTDDGSIYVSDGYGDTKCHRFDAAGRHELSWGEPGTGPGQFALPHGIWVLRDGRVLVADRENDRIQVFDRDGAYITEWGDIPLPSDFYVDEERGAVFVSELNRGITVFDLDGKVITRWAQEREPPDRIGGPHGIWVDDQGAIYVGEVGADSYLHKWVPAR
ncbi:MAG: hypothetical protein OXF96_02535 [Chloroflexi bacterium]|nr:hypothetical protein [Chloroflexota bacterium]